MGASLAADFTDRTLPPGRAQGVPGPIAASRFVRAAIPDLQADLPQLIVAGDRVTAHYRFPGHFTGQWAGRHIEDNLTLMQQPGLAAR
jgi:predicted ester cyclase